jgi:hypothetical protein
MLVSVFTKCYIFLLLYKIYALVFVLHLVLASRIFFYTTHASVFDLNLLLASLVFLF